MKAILIISLAAIGFAACNGNTDNKSRETTTSKTADTSQTAPVKSTATVSNATSLSNVLSAYLQIKNGLVDDNAKEAANGGNAFVAALGNVDKTSMTADQKKVFDETADDAKEMAEHIGKSADKIAHQREHFEMLSGDVYDMVKAFKTNKPLYKDFCPMYNNGKGADWISETKDIKNPYLGKKMPDCGEVKEEIK